MSSADRIIRVVLALLFAYLYLSGTITGTLGIVLVVLGVVFLATSLLGWCGLYSIFGISTCAVKKV